jgi:hypothetical protein
MDTDWEDKIPMVYVCALERIEGLPDHALILLTTGTLRHPCKHIFKFELGWLHREEFHDMVKNVWERPVSGRSPIVRWNNKLCALHKHLSVINILKKEKLRLSSIIYDLEVLAEVLEYSDLKLSSSWKVIRILDISMVLPMANTGKKTYSLSITG